MYAIYTLHLALHACVYTSNSTLIQALSRGSTGRKVIGWSVFKTIHLQKLQRRVPSISEMSMGMVKRNCRARTDLRCCPLLSSEETRNQEMGERDFHHPN